MKDIYMIINEEAVGSREWLRATSELRHVIARSSEDKMAFIVEDSDWNSYVFKLALKTFANCFGDCTSSSAAEFAMRVIRDSEYKSEICIIALECCGTALEDDVDEIEMNCFDEYGDVWEIIYKLFHKPPPNKKEWWE